MVHPQPRYRFKPSSRNIRTTPRPRNASGFTCLLILRTSNGRRTYTTTCMSRIRALHAATTTHHFANTGHAEHGGAISALHARGETRVTHLPARACVMSLPLRSPNVFVNCVL